MVRADYFESMNSTVSVLCAYKYRAIPALLNVRIDSPIKDIK